MSTIKKIGVLVSMAFLALGPAGRLAALDIGGTYGLSLSPLLGLLYGQGEEILYKYPNGDQYVSQLLWDLKPLFYTGLAVDYGPRDPFESNGLIASFSLKYGLPFKTGIMEDRDWLFAHNENLTNYSRHDAYSQNAILLDISAGYTWRLTERLALGVYGEFSYMWFSWMAEDGYFQYVSFIEDPVSGAPIPKPGEGWNKDIPKQYIYGPGIRYSQRWITLSPGLSLKGKINDLFSLEGNLSYSPLIHVVARDDHLLTGATFWDYCSFGHYFGTGGTFIFSPLKALDLSFSLSYRYITGPRGDSYWKQNGVNVNNAMTQNAYDGGAGYSTLDVGIAARFYLFTKD